MAKDHSEKKEKKDKKERKEKKEKHAENDAVVKKSKKEKKEKRKSGEVMKALEEELEKSSPTPVTALVKKDDEGDVEMDMGVTTVEEAAVAGALVPFAFPLAESEKEVKKIFKGVKKSAKQKTLRRGVKEVVKALRKSPTSEPASSTSSTSTTLPAAVVIIAADISPMDVISHIPVLCEDHNIPYIYVKSRAQLGEASGTKRPTSVVMVSREPAGGKKKVESDGGEFAEAYKDLVKLVLKAGEGVKK